MFLSKLIYQISSNIWYDIGDTSNDLNFYTKRLILYNIIQNSLFYWRKNKNVEDVLNFTERQIRFFGKLGKQKYLVKERLKEKFSILHCN